jgi:hypothetical protein
MAWLVREGDVLAAADAATSRRDGLKGLWGRPRPDGALVLRRPLLLHTVGVGYAVDVAFCNEDMVVIATVRLPRFRVARPRRGAKLLVVAGEGAFERWRLTTGDRLEVTGK